MSNQQSGNGKETSEAFDKWNELSALVNSLYGLAIYTAIYILETFGKGSCKLFRVTEIIAKQKNILDEKVFQFALKHPEEISRNEAIRMFYDTKRFTICIKDKKYNRDYIIE